MPAFRRSANRKLSADRDGGVISARNAIAVPLGAPHDLAWRDSRRAEILTVDARYSMGIVPVAKRALLTSSGAARRAACSVRPEKPS